LILTWYKLLDDVSDEKKPTSRAALTLMKPLFKKLKKSRGALCDEVGTYLNEMSRLEKEKSSNLDQVAETFAKILEAVFLAGPGTMDDNNKRVLARLGYHLGKWIYLMDAWDDLKENLISGAYNPLIYRYNYSADETLGEFKNRIKDSCEWHLLLCCGEMGKALDLLDIKKNSSIIENIVYLGLLRRTENVLGKEDEKDGESL
jgi:hypothetical protein